MTYIIAEPCIGVKDRACVEVCPVDCIYEYVEEVGGFVVPDPSTGSGPDKQVIPRGDVTHIPPDHIPKDVLTAQLYIHPDECIDCGACESVCPVTAIFAEADVPDQWKAKYIPLQYEVFGLEKK
ncbi:MAG: ferredoxin family protein [Armatimonadota bacterium]|nr:ferredoxin family protein [Armatimonadota bacterium]